MSDLTNEELLLVLDENGNSTNKLEKRSVVHNDLLWHNEIALWILNLEEKSILLQRRAKTKKTNPNKLALCMGHVCGFDTLEETVIREVKEELWVDISNYPLNKLLVARCSKETNHCFSHHFYIVANIPISKITVQLEELSEAVYMNYEEFKTRIKSSDGDLAFKYGKTYDQIFEVFDKIFI